jgi:glycosyltransferase involved in cell wall biosynthesis
VHKPTLSIITIVYNNVRDIERTLLSVLNQSYAHIEYIVIDGASSDGTLEVIQRYQDKLSKVVSEKDAGIYDAMNKGLALASGDYVLFMNSGDELYAPNTVESVFATAHDADIYYGETEMYNEAWQSIGKRRHSVPEKFTWKSFRFGMTISHQAIYIRRTLTEQYDRQYELSADIDWILTAAKKAKTSVKVSGYVAKYLVGGMSKKRHHQSLKERFAIFTKHYGLLPNLFNHVVIAAKLSFYYIRYGRSND